MLHQSFYIKCEHSDNKLKYHYSYSSINIFIEIIIENKMNSDLDIVIPDKLSDNISKKGADLKRYLGVKYGLEDKKMELHLIKSIIIEFHTKTRNFGYDRSEIHKITEKFVELTKIVSKFESKDSNPVQLREDFWRKWNGIVSLVKETFKPRSIKIFKKDVIQFFNDFIGEVNYHINSIDDGRAENVLKKLNEIIIESYQTIFLVKDDKELPEVTAKLFRNIYKFSTFNISQKMGLFYNDLRRLLCSLNGQIRVHSKLVQNYIISTRQFNNLCDFIERSTHKLEVHVHKALLVRVKSNIANSTRLKHTVSIVKRKEYPLSIVNHKERDLIDRSSRKNIYVVSPRKIHKRLVLKDKTYQIERSLLRKSEENRIVKELQREYEEKSNQLHHSRKRDNNISSKISLNEAPRKTLDTLHHDDKKQLNNGFIMDTSDLINKQYHDTLPNIDSIENFYSDISDDNKENEIDIIDDTLDYSPSRINRVLLREKFRDMYDKNTNSEEDINEGETGFVLDINKKGSNNIVRRYSDEFTSQDFEEIGKPKLSPLSLVNCDTDLANYKDPNSLDYYNMRDEIEDIVQSCFDLEIPIGKPRFNSLHVLKTDTDLLHDIEEDNHQESVDIAKVNPLHQNYPKSQWPHSKQLNENGLQESMVLSSSDGCESDNAEQEEVKSKYSIENYANTYMNNTSKSTVHSLDTVENTESTEQYVCKFNDGEIYVPSPIISRNLMRCESEIDYKYTDNFSLGKESTLVNNDSSKLNSKEGYEIKYNDRKIFDYDIRTDSSLEIKANKAPDAISSDQKIRGCSTFSNFEKDTSYMDDFQNEFNVCNPDSFATPPTSAEKFDVSGSLFHTSLTNNVNESADIPQINDIDSDIPLSKDELNKVTVEIHKSHEDQEFKVGDMNQADTTRNYDYNFNEFTEISQTNKYHNESDIMENNYNKINDENSVGESHKKDSNVRYFEDNIIDYEETERNDTTYNRDFVATYDEPYDLGNSGEEDECDDIVSEIERNVVSIPEIIKEDVGLKTKIHDGTYEGNEYITNENDDVSSKKKLYSDDSGIKRQEFMFDAAKHTSDHEESEQDQNIFYDVKEADKKAMFDCYMDKNEKELSDGIQTEKDSNISTEYNRTYTSTLDFGTGRDDFETKNLNYVNNHTCEKIQNQDPDKEVEEGVLDQFQNNSYQNLLHKSDALKDKFSYQGNIMEEEDNEDRRTMSTSNRFSEDDDNEEDNEVFFKGIINSSNVDKLTNQVQNSLLQDISLYDHDDMLIHSPGELNNEINYDYLDNNELYNSIVLSNTHEIHDNLYDMGPESPKAEEFTGKNAYKSIYEYETSVNMETNELYNKKTTYSLPLEQNTQHPNIEEIEKISETHSSCMPSQYTNQIDSLSDTLFIRKNISDRGTNEQSLSKIHENDDPLIDDMIKEDFIDKVIEKSSEHFQEVFEHQSNDNLIDLNSLRKPIPDLMNQDQVSLDVE